MEGRGTFRSPTGWDLQQRHHSPGWSVWAVVPPFLQPVVGVRPAAPPPPVCLGSKVPGGWLGLLTPTHGSRCLVLVPITISSRATRDIVIQTPGYNSQVWFPSALEPGLRWAAWPLSPCLFVWENVSLSGILSLYAWWYFKYNMFLWERPLQ